MRRDCATSFCYKRLLATMGAITTGALPRALQVLRDGVAARVFPGAAFAVVQRGAAITGEAGRFTYDDNAPPVTPATVFDLASLTKPIATTTMAMLLAERGRLELEAPITSVLPEFAAASTDDVRRRRVSFRMLLAHSSGLPGYAPLYQHCHTRTELLERALALPLEAEPG